MLRQLSHVHSMTAKDTASVKKSSSVTNSSLNSGTFTVSVSSKTQTVSFHVPKTGTLNTLVKKIKKEFGFREGIFLKYFNTTTNEWIKLDRNAWTLSDNCNIQVMPVSFLSRAEEPIIANMTSAMIITDKHGDVAFVNKAAQAMFGFGTAEISWKNLSDLMATADGKDFRTTLATALDRKKAAFSEPGNIQFTKVVQCKSKNSNEFRAQLSFSETRHVRQGLFGLHYFVAAFYLL
jgi:PAS domain S-box-containing protein